MADGDGERPTGFLPPEPAGPEPELGSRPTAPAPPPEAGRVEPPHPGQAQPGWPPPGRWQAPPAAGPQHAPPQFPPPGQAPAPALPPGAYGYAPRPEPDNGPALAGFVLALVAAGLLVVSVGTSSLISVGCAIVGLVYSRQGKRRLDAGETRKHAGLAQAGWVIGWISLALSLVATAFWGLILVLIATDGDFREDFERELEDSESFSTALLLALATARIAGYLLR